MALLNARRNPRTLVRGSFVEDFPGGHKTATSLGFQAEVKNAKGFVTFIEGIYLNHKKLSIKWG